MNEKELEMLELLEGGRKRIGEIAAALGIGKSYASMLADSLEKASLARKSRDGKSVFVEIPGNPKAILFRKLLRNYNCKVIFRGGREDQLILLLEPVTTHEVASRSGISTKSAYNILNDLRSAGVALEKDGKHFIDPGKGDVLEYVRMLKWEKAQAGAEGAAEVVWRGGNEMLKKAPLGEKASGSMTAFSAFSGKGVAIMPKEQYLYSPAKSLSLEEILVHSLVFSATKQDMVLATIFYLKTKAKLGMEETRRLAHHFGASDKLFDMLAYLDKRPVRQGELFLPWGEFKEKAAIYGISVRESFGLGVISKTLEEIGSGLGKRTSVYLIGGGNMMLRGMKTATKDIDFVLEGRAEFETLRDALREIGFERKTRIERTYMDMAPSLVVERDKMRIDIFTKTVCNALRLTREMERHAETKAIGNMELGLLSLEDIFLFKSITDREGDLEDCRIIAERGMDWRRILESVLQQEKATGRYFSFSVLDTLHALEERYGIKAPILKKLDSHCLEVALLISLKAQKGIKEMKAEIEVPEHQIMNKLRKMEKEGKIRVSRKGKLNMYEAVHKIRGAVIR